MQQFVVDLHISPDEYKKLYSGAAQSVSAKAIDGRRLRFPAQSLRGFVTTKGISGRFELIVSDQNKLIECRRLI
jgi:hypothetical protein